MRGSLDGEVSQQALETIACSIKIALKLCKLSWIE